MTTFADELAALILVWKMKKYNLYRLLDDLDAASEALGDELLQGDD